MSLFLETLKCAKTRKPFHVSLCPLLDQPQYYIKLLTNPLSVPKNSPVSSTKFTRKLGFFLWERGFSL